MGLKDLLVGVDNKPLKKKENPPSAPTLDRSKPVGPIDLEDIDIGDDFPVKPTDNHLIVRRAPVRANIIIPDSAKDRLAKSYGVVIAAGKGYRNPMTNELVENDIKVGDYVLFDEYSGSPFNHDGYKFYHMVRKDVVAKIDPDKWNPNKYLRDGERGDVPSANAIVKPRARTS